MDNSIGLIDMLLDTKAISFDRTLDPGSDIIYFVALKSIDILGRFDDNPNHLPDDLESLSLRGNYVYTVKYLPPRLKSLTLGHYFDATLDLPDTLTHLHLGVDFDQPIERLPTNLQFLDINRRYPYIEQLRKILLKGAEIEISTADPFGYFEEEDYFEHLMG